MALSPMTNEKANIFCPNCGANNKIEQSFCRFCGLNLVGSVKALRTQFADREKSERFIKLEWMKRASDYLSISLAAAIFLMLFSVAYSFYTSGELNFRRVWMGLIFLLIFSQSGLSYWRRKNTVGYADELAEKKAAARNELKILETKKLIEERPFEPATASVTENSTRLFFAENKTTKLE